MCIYRLIFKDVIYCICPSLANVRSIRVFCYRVFSRSVVDHTDAVANHSPISMFPILPLSYKRQHRLVNGPFEEDMLTSFYYLTGLTSFTYITMFDIGRYVSCRFNFIT